MLEWMSQKVSHETVSLIPVTALLRTRSGLEYACSYIPGNNVFSFWMLGQFASFQFGSFAIEEVGHGCSRI